MWSDDEKLDFHALARNINEQKKHLNKRWECSKFANQKN